MKTGFNKAIERTVLKTVTSITPENWYGYTTFKTEGYEFHLSYHYGRVYFNYCRYNNNGWRSGGTQTPLSNIDNRFLWLDFAKVLFKRDKKRKIIEENYVFQ